MTIAQSLAELATHGATSALLGTCKLEWAGSQVCGTEAIGESFRTSPLNNAPVAQILQCQRNACWFDGETALFVEHYEGRIARLWRIGLGSPPAHEHAVSVPFDPSLHQHQGDIQWRPGDHPALDPNHLPAILAGSSALLAARDGAPQLRACAFLSRAFSVGDCAAALFAVHRLSGSDLMTSAFSFAVVAIVGSETLHFNDLSLPSRQAPRL